MRPSKLDVKLNYVTRASLILIHSTMKQLFYLPTEGSILWFFKSILMKSKGSS